MKGITSRPFFFKSRKTSKENRASSPTQSVSTNRRQSSDCVQQAFPEKAPAKAPEKAPADDYLDSSSGPATGKAPADDTSSSVYSVAMKAPASSSSSSVCCQPDQQQAPGYVPTIRATPQLETVWLTRPMKQAYVLPTVPSSMGLTEQEYALVNLTTPELDHLEKELQRWVPDSDLASLAFRRLWTRRDLSPERRSEFKRVREWNKRADFCEARLIDLIPAAVNAPSAILRFYAMVFMTKVGFQNNEAFNSEYLTAALERGLSDTNLYVRNAALSAALKYHGEGKREALMRRALCDRSPIVRAIVLGKVKDCDQALVEERAKVETDERVQFVLAAFGGSLKGISDFDAFAGEGPMKGKAESRAQFNDVRNNNPSSETLGTEWCATYFGRFGSTIYRLVDNGLPRRNDSDSASSSSNDSVRSVGSALAFY